MKLLITNGRLIDPKNRRDGKFDLLIEDGKVREILKPGTKVDNAKRLDASHCIVAPGFVDLHTHLREPGYEYKETIETGTQSAAAGGFTSICCMANTHPVNDKASVTEFILKKARSVGMVNVYPVGAVTKGLEGEELAEIGELHQAGCVAISDDGNTIRNSRLMRMALEYAGPFRIPIITHSICPDLSGDGVMNESFTSTRLGLSGIPNAAEEVIMARDIHLVRLTGSPLHVAHVSTAGGVELIRRAKREGLPVTCEVTPHHLTLTDLAVEGYDTHTKMMPPLRSEADRVSLLKGLADGTVDALATDHAPHAAVDKEVEYARASFGIVGLETALPLVLGAAAKQKIPLKRVIEALTVNPSKIVNIRKGSLGKGDDADVVIFDPEESWKIDPSQFHSKSRNTPFGGMKVKGRVRWTIVGGRIVFGES